MPYSEAYSDDGHTIFWDKNGPTWHIGQKLDVEGLEIVLYNYKAVSDSTCPVGQDVPWFSVVKDNNSKDPIGKLKDNILGALGSLGLGNLGLGNLGLGNLGLGNLGLGNIGETISGAAKKNQKRDPKVQLICLGGSKSECCP